MKFTHSTFLVMLFASVPDKPDFAITPDLGKYFAEWITKP